VWTCRTGNEIALVRMGSRNRIVTRWGGVVMRWARITAVVIGIAGSGVAFLATNWWFFATGESSMTRQEAIFYYGVLLCGPLSLIAATAVAWKFERMGGYWLVLGGVVYVELNVMWQRELASRKFFSAPFKTASTQALAFQIVSAVPMLPAGSLWLLYASKAKRKLLDQEA